MNWCTQFNGRHLCEEDIAIIAFLNFHQLQPPAENIFARSECWQG